MKVRAVILPQADCRYRSESMSTSAMRHSPTAVFRSNVRIGDKPIGTQKSDYALVQRAFWAVLVNC